MLGADGPSCPAFITVPSSQDRLQQQTPGLRGSVAAVSLSPAFNKRRVTPLLFTSPHGHGAGKGFGARYNDSRVFPFSCPY